MKRGAPARASREFWVLAALEALQAGGVEAVAVEPVAKRLGVTKGSFYWHFESRADLLEAALLLWEQRGTTDVLAALDRIPDPAERLRSIFRRVAEASASHGSVHAVLSATRDPSVSRVLERVAATRLAYFARCYTELGLSKTAARKHGFLAYAAWLGTAQLAHDLPSTQAERDAFADHVVETLIPEKRVR